MSLSENVPPFGVLSNLQHQWVSELAAPLSLTSSFMTSPFKNMFTDAYYQTKYLYCGRVRFHTYISIIQYVRDI